MNVDYIDFKTVSLTSKLDTSIGAELQLTQTGKVSVKLPEEWSGFAFLYLNIVIHDPEDKYFVFDITTETVIKLPDDVKEFSEEAMNAGMEIAQDKTFEAIRGISAAMGINELDLSGK